MKDAVKYIKKCLKLGLTEEAINQQLKDSGWKDEVIKEAWVKARKSAFAGISLWLQKSNKKILIGLPAAAVILLIGYVAYANFFTGSPDRIWGKAYENTTKAQSWKSRSEITYMDKSKSGEEFILIATNEGRYRQTPQSLPDFELKSEVKLKAQGLDIGFSLESRKLGNILFYKIGDAPLLSLFLGTSASGETPKSEWLKIDLDKKIEGQFSVLEFMQTFQKDFKDLRQSFWQLKFLKLVKRLENDKIGEVPAWHYESEISKEELDNYVNTLLKGLGSEKQFEELNKNINEALETLLQKLDFQKVEIWIGKKDKRVHQVLIETNAPSLMSVDLMSAQPAEIKNFQQFIGALPFSATLTIKSSFSNFDQPVSIEAPEGAVDYFEYLKKTTEISLNAKAVSDVRQIMTALELFFNDKKAYPKRIGELSPTYLYALPQPLKDEALCPGINDFFNYGPAPDRKGYQLDFCLTAATENLPAGRHQASPQGIR